MPDQKKITSALLSVYNKSGLTPLVEFLHKSGITIYATGGTQALIEQMGIDVIPVEQLTGFPSVLGGRVKTLHPKVFGGILARRENSADIEQMDEFQIPPIDLVVVDLYPFSETIEAGGTHDEIIEKIDIGGVSLIRAAAKNFTDVTIISSVDDYPLFMETVSSTGAATTLEFRKKMAAKAFAVTSHYDTAIWEWMSGNDNAMFKKSIMKSRPLRYGENPHQLGVFYGNLDEMFEQLSGKELSYNNLLDIDAAISLVLDFKTPVTAILKHNNACGVATGNDPIQNWKRALEADPVSAFGGILITTSEVDAALANEMNILFFEVLIAPSYTPEALTILTAKKNRMLLKLKQNKLQEKQYRTILNGVLGQDRDTVVETADDLTVVTEQKPTPAEISDMLIANIIVKHSRSNTIVLVKDSQLIAAGVGQTARVDALDQAIAKAHKFGIFTTGSVMASDAFFPFPDCVSIAHKAGITAVIQPGGSKRDQESIDVCNRNNMKMVITGTRHFRH
jgi:phosphoribosylaminoimidazolecarboxamide formyltransferase / IMP cyclohydrolase